MSTELRYDVKSVAIIGAGPSGIATAKYVISDNIISLVLLIVLLSSRYLLAEEAFDKIDIFEQRSNVGGVWNYTPDALVSPTKVPQVDPHQLVEEPQWSSSGSKYATGLFPRGKVTFTSPMYDALETNIPNFLMQFSDKPFPRDSQLFPGRKEVAKYLREYAEEVQHLVNFQVQVLDVRPQKSASREKWAVKTKEMLSQHESEAIYDAVIVANGHFNVPYVPDIEGIARWNEQNPGIISHSRSYRRPNLFKGKKVVVVGNAASGSDIGAQISTVCKLPIIFSQRSVSYLSPGAQAFKDEALEIVEFLPSASYSRAVRFADGRIEQDIDAIVFCTGYLYSYPFLDSLTPLVISDGMRVQHVYRHIFYEDRPTLAFVGLPVKIIPFFVSEAQAAVISRVWSGRLALPNKEEMEGWERSVIMERGAERGFHMLGFPLDVDYLDELRDWALTAVPNPALGGKDGRGKLPPRWGEKERWARERFLAIKKAFAERGESRHRIRSMEELDFDFEACKGELDAVKRSSRL